MTKRLALFVFAALIFATSCGIAEGPREKLKHTVFLFNEGLRWGRYGDVLPRVDPAATEQFAQTHEGWGENTQISSAEIIEWVIGKKIKKADVTVKYVWYKKNEMVVHDTVTIQHWEHREGNWYMIAEEHKSGTPF